MNKIWKKKKNGKWSLTDYQIESLGFRADETRALLKEKQPVSASVRVTSVQ